MVRSWLISDWQQLDHKQILTLIQEFPIKGIAHITGGGITENLPRVFPDGVRARINRKAWTVPPLFDALSQLGQVDREEMYRVFNMGIGLIIIVPDQVADTVMARAATLGDQAYRIGEIIAGRAEDPRVEYVD